MRGLLTIALVFSSFQCLIGQTIDPESNWSKEVHGVDYFLSRFDLRKYTIGDVEKAKSRFLLIEKQKPLNEWEGAYRIGTGVGAAELVWSGSEGFVYTYIYHTLAGLDYGTASDSGSSIRLQSQRSHNPAYSPLFSNDLVKVRFGARHYLVPNVRLGDFASRAVGLSPDLEDWAYYWEKLDDSEKNVSGLPIFPRRYANLVQKPITTKILRVGKSRIHQDKLDDGTINFQEVFIPVTLSGGSNKRIRKGMNFYVDNLGEWVEIMRVDSNRSYGRIRRGLDNENHILCLNSEHGQGDIITCKPIRIGMSARTKLSDLFF